MKAGFLFFASRLFSGFFFFFF
ncbi:hypothetical protein D030_1269A, partial [Vibrio parahaemolyticus AQ3810]